MTINEINDLKSTDISPIEINDLDDTRFNNIVIEGIENIPLIKGPKGEQGKPGPKGETGKAFEYSDFTEEQLEGLKGPKGDVGPVGPPITLKIGKVENGKEANATITGSDMDKELNLVLPKGETGKAFEYSDFTEEQLKGLKGPKGEAGTDGISAGFGIVTATIDNSSEGIPNVEVITEGENTAKNFIFNFKNIKGDKGDKGDNGNKGDTGNGIENIELVDGTHKSGELDTYRITYTDKTTKEIQIYNGKDGQGSGDMQKSIYDTDNDGIVEEADHAKTADNSKTADNASKVNNHTVEKDVPSNANFSDTIYTLPNASASTLGGIKVGTNLLITSDGVLSSKDTTYSNVTIEKDGLMSKEDKDKLEGIASGANKTIVENLLTSTSITNALSAAQGKVLNDKIDNGNKYSTDEVKTNKVWIDGKPIYRKCFTKSSLDEKENSIPTNITNLDVFVDMRVLIRNNQEASKQWRTVPWIPYPVNAYPEWVGGFFYQNSDNAIIFQTGSELSKIDMCIVILEYTKN